MLKPHQMSSVMLMCYSSCKCCVVTDAGGEGSCPGTERWVLFSRLSGALQFHISIQITKSYSCS